MANVNAKSQQTSSVRIDPSNMKPSAQKLSTYPSTGTNNLKRQGIGATTIGVAAKTVTYKGAGNPNRSYPVAIVNRAVAKIGGR